MTCQKCKHEFCWMCKQDHRGHNHRKCGWCQFLKVLLCTFVLFHYLMLLNFMPLIQSILLKLATLLVKNLLLYNGLIAMFILSILSFTGYLGSMRQQNKTLLKYIFGLILDVIAGAIVCKLYYNSMMWDFFWSILIEICMILGFLTLVHLNENWIWYVK